MVLAENGCAQLHVFTRIYTKKHNVVFVNVMGYQFGKGRQILPVWILRNRSPHVRGAAFCRLLPPFVAFCRLFRWGG